MANIMQRVLQFATLGAFLLAMAFVVGAFGSSTWKWDALGSLLDSLKNVFCYFFYTLMAASGYGTGLGLSSNVFILGHNQLSQALLFPYLNVMFHMTDVAGNVVIYTSFDDLWDAAGTPPIYSLLADQGIAIGSNLYFLLFMLLFLLAIIYITLFFGRSDIKYTIQTVTCLAGMLVLASFPSLVKKILDMFGLPPAFYTPFFDAYFPDVNIQAPDLVASTSTWGAVWAAFFIYACLELSFQAAYVTKVSQPSAQRARMLKEQMMVLGETSLQFEVEKQQQELARKAGGSGGGGVAGVVGGASPAAAMEERKRITLRSFFTGAGLGAIQEMIERRERERERTRLEEVSSDTRRLHGYINRLFEVDKRARETLTAVGSAPSQKNLASSTLLNMGVRLLALLGLVLLVINPQVLYAVFNVPPIIAESFEFYSPEAVVTAIVPIAMLFPVVSFSIRLYKQYKLTKYQARREEESAILKRLSELREVEEQETVISDEEKKVSKEEASTGTGS
ncbi:MAG: hypothetical protein GYA24_00585 [Candidatus Lokiarchaeota archaeon]|nr:hypothetical protein [Candidatus Lokiarchaeota archaeon]